MRSRLLPVLVLLPLLRVSAATAEAVVVEVVRDATVHWNPERPEIVEPDGYVIRHGGQTIERTVALPEAPGDQRDARRIVAVVEVRPVQTATAGGPRPHDPWTRLGRLAVLVPDGAGGPASELEVMRFVTGYGGPATYEQDVTPLAPALSGTRTLRTSISTYADRPGWTVSVTLRYDGAGVGPRRPIFVRGLLDAPHVTAEAPRIATAVTIPPGLDRPRLRVLSTGHATDGAAGNEFVSCPHVLRIDGREIARWRPWAEGGGILRDRNPWAGRRTIDGREVRSSDLDRTGWLPGLVVEPLVIPVPELTPGRHVIELEILGIRPRDPAGPRHHGYWVESVAVVADEEWPEEEGTGEAGTEGLRD